MIELYRPADCKTCADIEEALKDMVIGHKVIVVENDQTPETLPAATPLPALRDEGQVITGRANITAHLQRLERIVADWRKYESDSCYIGDDGETC